MIVLVLEFVGLSAVLVGCAVAYSALHRKISAKNAGDRRAHLKDRARSL